MRIVAGRFRRRQLLSNPGETTRPITDRAKVILFDLLQPQLEGKRVADIFCGTGSMGLEALSRGAASCVFIEQDHSAYELLMKNVTTVGALEESICWRTNAFLSSFRPKGKPHFLPYDLVFFDPPYRVASELQPGTRLYKAWERLADPRVTSPEVLLVFRTDHHAEFQPPPVWQLDHQRRINSMMLWFYRKNPASGASVDEDSSVVGDESSVPEDDPLWFA